MEGEGNTSTLSGDARARNHLAGRVLSMAREQGLASCMRLFELLFGRRLRSAEDELERIGPLTAVPALGLDALASAAYGPEAALTVLLKAGVDGASYIVPITAVILVVLALVAISYGQTI